MTSNDEDKKRMVQVSIPATVSLKKSEYDAEVELSILIANTWQYYLSRYRHELVH